jgi:hypothetical protein
MRFITVFLQKHVATTFSGVMHVCTIKQAFCFEVYGTYSNNWTLIHCTRYIMDLSNISEDMAAKIKAILPALGSRVGPSSDDVPILDLSVAENELIRDELLELTKDALNNHLHLKVSP